MTIFLDSWKQRVDIEVEWLRNQDPAVDVVVLDAPFLSALAAKNLGIPTVLVSNFTFDAIFEGIHELGMSGRSRKVCNTLGEFYSNIDFLLRLPGAIPIPRFDTAMQCDTKGRDFEFGCFERGVLDATELPVENMDGFLVNFAAVSKMHSYRATDTHPIIDVIKMLSKPVKLPLFPRVVNLPLIVRMAQTPRDMFRIALGIPVDAKVVLITFGGHSVTETTTASPARSRSQSPVRAATPNPACEFSAEQIASTAPASANSLNTILNVSVSAAETWERDSPVYTIDRIAPTGWHTLIAVPGPKGDILNDYIEITPPEHISIAPADAFVPDLLQASDVVVGKCGYGTCAEVVAHGVPLVYVPRPAFVEEVGLVNNLMRPFGMSVEMSQKDFYAGNWAASILNAHALKKTGPAMKIKRSGEVLATRIGTALLLLVSVFVYNLSNRQISIAPVNPLSYSWLPETKTPPSNPPTSDPAYPTFSTISRPNPIPNIILRTWKTADISEIQHASQTGLDHPDRYTWFQTWTDMNPRAVQIVIADAQMDAFVRSAFSRRVVQAYFKLPRMVLRADFLRYMMLYEIGGVYTDMDTSCAVPIYQWNLGLEGVAVIVGVEDPGYHSDDKYGKGIDSIQQWTMASARHHPFMAKVVHAVTEKIHSMTEQQLLDADVLELTGPGIWKGVVFEHLHSLGADLEASANMWSGYKLYGDFLVVGKHYLNNDNGNNPKAFIRHHFTGFTSFGWRQSGNTLANETRKMFAKEADKSVSTPPTKSKSKKVSLVLDAELDEDFNWHYTPLAEVVSRNVSTTPATIPKVIIQVANTSQVAELPPKFMKLRESWTTLNQEYIVKLWSEQEMNRFIFHKCSTEEQKAFNHLPLLMQRVHLFRFLYLVEYGGVYVEIDTQCRVPVNLWNLGRKNVGLMLGFKDQHHATPSLQQSVIAAMPNHPLIAEYVRTLVEDILGQSQQDLETRVNFNDFFRDRFNRFVKSVLERSGVETESELARLSWYGHVEVGDVMIHGNERFAASNHNNVVAFGVQEGGLWSDMWREETKAAAVV
ncbi:hypothetical protein HDU98_000612 [Podochytrium sp. JEL0797]|nr:hypothetical protein HDU98_000612 [Podochytrium sp. JEL0797]